MCALTGFRVDGCVGAEVFNTLLLFSRQTGRGEGEAVLKKLNFRKAGQRN